MARPIIEVTNLSKAYRLGEIGTSSFRDEVTAYWRRLRGREKKPDQQDFWALRDVSFSVQPGEVVGIIGRNGAGKSTLLKILSRITEPTGGRAVLRGRVASLLEVGTGFHPDLSGRDNIYLNGAILGMTRAEVRQKFDEIVTFAEVEQFIDTPVKRYSSGMYVRLAFAVAAHLDPEILIVDEVLAVGDTAFQKKCLGRIREISAQSGRTVLFVSHNIEAVRSLCMTCVHISGGRLQQHGPVDAVVQSYLVDLARHAARRAPQRDPLWECSAEWFSDGIASPHLQSGKPACLKLRLAYRGSAALKDINVGFGIHSLADTPIIINYSQLYQRAYCFAAGEYIIEARIEKLPLPPGSYQVYVRLEKEGRDVFYSKAPAGEFEVVENRFFPAAHLMKNYGNPVMYCDVDWSS